MNFDAERIYGEDELAGIVIPWNGRCLVEALENDPRAPKPKGRRKNWLGADIIAYLEGDVPSNLSKNKAASLIAKSALLLLLDAVSNGEYYKTLARNHLDAALKAKDDLIERLLEIAQLEISPALRKAKLATVYAVGEKDTCGVYFLKLDNEVVYVGQTTNFLARIGKHVKDKQFDSVVFIRCEKSELSDLEGLFIRLFQPPLNGVQDGGIHAPKSKYWDGFTEATAKEFSRLAQMNAKGLYFPDVYHMKHSLRMAVDDHFKRSA